ncbi:unnamed protein product [marine sediment metagenome]|uniref:Uncharacterized protein n=1 Tax=marine sediment metagenome TaxID=412755 RepID=X1JHU4_9ZZZZ
MLGFLPSLISISADDLATTTAYIGEIFADVSVFVWLAIGVPLAFFVIKKVIGLVRGNLR